MERSIILKNTETGQELTLPVTPKSYPMATGRAVERLDMARTGQIALPGLNQLFSERLEFMLPAQSYPFLASGASADPWYYIKTITKWSGDGDVCRYIVAGTDINSPVLLGTLEYGEQDGSNDVYCKLPLYEYRYLDEVQVEKYTQNSGRPSETANQTTAGTYTVVKGDCLWAICRKFYGDGSLAYKLATANNISNPDLIYPGQVLIIPDKSVLEGYAATPAPTVIPDTTTTTSTTTTTTTSSTTTTTSIKLAQRQTTETRAAQTQARAEARAALRLRVG